jgi:hypothetical protein
MQCEGEEDYCCQATFAELLGVDVPCYVRAKWDKMNQARKKASIRRHTKEHKAKTAKHKKAARLRKAGDAKKAEAANDSYKSAGFQFNGGDDGGNGSGSGAAESSKGEKMGDCSQCGVHAVHAYRARMCSTCRKEKEDGKAKPKKTKAASKGKGKGKAKKRQKVMESDSESDVDITSESDCGTEDEYDEADDEELNTDVAIRLRKMTRNARIEVKFDTEEGPHWASGIVREVIDRDKGVVRFIDYDDSDFPAVLYLRVEVWKYL